MPFSFNVYLLLRMVWGYLVNKRLLFLQERSIIATRGHSPIILHLKTCFKGIQKTVGLFLHSVSRSWEHGVSFWKKHLRWLPVILQDSRENILLLRTSCQFVPGVKVPSWPLDMIWKCNKTEKCCSPISHPSDNIDGQHQYIFLTYQNSYINIYLT